MSVHIDGPGSRGSCPAPHGTVHQSRWMGPAAELPPVTRLPPRGNGSGHRYGCYSSGVPTLGDDRSPSKVPHHIPPGLGQNYVENVGPELTVICWEKFELRLGLNTIDVKKVDPKNKKALKNAFFMK